MARPKIEPLSPAEMQAGIDQWHRIASGARFAVTAMLPNEITFADGTTVCNADPKKLAEFRTNLSASIAPAVERPLARPKEVA